MYYYNLLHRAINHRNIRSRLPPAQRWHLFLNNGKLGLSKSYVPHLQITVSTPIEMANIYYLFKGKEPDIEAFKFSLEHEGIPTLVQAVHTGGTPPFDSYLYGL
jgi:hypothetical protein